MSQVIDEQEKKGMEQDWGIFYEQIEEQNKKRVTLKLIAILLIIRYVLNALVNSLLIPDAFRDWVMYFSPIQLLFFVIICIMMADVISEIRKKVTLHKKKLLTTNIMLITILPLKIIGGIIAYILLETQLLGSLSSESIDDLLWVYGVSGYYTEVIPVVIIFICLGLVLYHKKQSKIGSILLFASAGLAIIILIIQCALAIASSVNNIGDWTSLYYGLVVAYGLSAVIGSLGFLLATQTADSIKNIPGKKFV